MHKTILHVLKFLNHISLCKLPFEKFFLLRKTMHCMAKLCTIFLRFYYVFWTNNAWLEQRTRSHAHVLYFSILTLKPCITGNLFPLCLFSKNPTPKRCDYIYHILWKKSSVLIYAERSIFCCWSFFSISSIYESIVSVITILTMPMKYIKLCIWDVRFFVIVVHCFKALLIFPSVKNSLALSLSLSLSLLLIQF